MTIGELSTHIASLPVWSCGIIKADGFDFAVFESSEKKQTTEAILELFTKRSNEVEQVVFRNQTCN